LRLLFGLGVVAAGIAGLRATAFKTQPLEVRVAKAVRGVVESTITNSRAGTVRARRRAKLSAEIGGRVVEVVHVAGSRVAKGTLLVRLSDATQRGRLLASRQTLLVAKAQRDEATVRATRAQRELRRTQGLAETGLITPDQFDELTSRWEAASAGRERSLAAVSQATALVAVAEAELAKCQITAPFAGVLAEVDAELGEWISPAPPGLVLPGAVDLIDTSSIYVSAPMDEVDSATVSTGQRARVTLDSYPKRSFPAKVVRVAAYVLDREAQNRTVEVEVELEDSSFASKLLPGTSADVELICEVRADVVRIPAQALLEGGRVFTIEAGVIVERKVEVGLKNWDFVEIRQGIEEGQAVVTNLGMVGLEPGVAVRVLEGPSK
jgi:HlyD family secretion protein